MISSTAPSANKRIRGFLIVFGAWTLIGLFYLSQDAGRRSFFGDPRPWQETMYWAVRAAGIRVGTVRKLSLQSDETVLVAFDADRSVALTSGSRAAVRYLNLVGDRYLELIDGPGSTTIMPPGARIPINRTAGALDLDLLLGGLKPVIQGLNPQDVNALTASLIQIFEGQGSTMESLASHTASFSSALATGPPLAAAKL